VRRKTTDPPRDEKWLNRTVLGIGTTSFFSDVAHEIATAILPVVSASLGSPALVLGVVEGVADAASGVAKLWSGWFSDRLRRRKPLAIAGYVVTALFTALLGLAAHVWQAVAARSIAWIGRGIRTPARSTLLAEGTPPSHYGKAFGFERGMDTLGAVVGPFAAAGLVVVMSPRALLLWTIVPGLLAALCMAALVREAPRTPSPPRPFLLAMTSLPRGYRSFLVAVGLFGLGDFAHTLLILRGMEVFTPALGATKAAAASMSLYGLHNIAGAILSLGFGVAGDRFGRVRVLALSYLLGPLMVVLLVLPSPGGGSRSGLLMIAAFLAGGALLAAEEALEGAAAAELLPREQRGSGFGALAAINSAGDLVSSVAVGGLWKVFGPSAGFCAALLPMLAAVLFLLPTIVRREPES
jgi:MFS family permease